MTRSMPQDVTKHEPTEPDAAKTDVRECRHCGIREHLNQATTGEWSCLNMDACRDRCASQLTQARNDLFRTNGEDRREIAALREMLIECEVYIWPSGVAAPPNHVKFAALLATPTPEAPDDR